MDLIAALRAFVRVTETGSFSAVARETHASQSAVTRLVAQLEQHFDVRLFHRTTRRLSLTDDGQVLMAHARHVIESADEMETVLGRQSGAPRGLVRLGTSIAGGLFLATRLPVLLARHPGLSVALVMRDQNSDMVEERLDLAFRSGEIADASLVARRVGFLGRAVVASPVYLERQWRAVDAGGSRGAYLPDPRRGDGTGGVALHRPGRSAERAGDRGSSLPTTARQCIGRRAPAMASPCCRRSS